MLLKRRKSGTVGDCFQQWINQHLELKWAVQTAECCRWGRVKINTVCMFITEHFNQHNNVAHCCILIVFTHQLSPKTQRMMISQHVNKSDAVTAAEKFNTDYLTEVLPICMRTDLCRRLVLVSPVLLGVF